MIIPVSLIFTMITAAKKRGNADKNSKLNYSIKKIFPWFIVWFLIAALLNTLGLFKGQVLITIGQAGKFMIVMALSAVGLNADFKKMIKTGMKPMLLGLIVWITVALVSIAIQKVTGQL